MARAISIPTATRLGPSSSTPTATTTLTLTETPESSASASSQTQQPQVLTLKLNRKKKKVTWKEGTVDNEFLQRKSSKKCCIFHKEKPFDEDDSDDEGAGDGLNGGLRNDILCVHHPYMP